MIVTMRLSGKGRGGKREDAHIIKNNIKLLNFAKPESYNQQSNWHIILSFVK